MNTALAINVLLQLILQVSGIVMKIHLAQREGRDLSDAELAAIVHSDDAMKMRLDAAILAARAPPA